MTPLDLALRGRLQTVRLGRAHRHHATVGSTQSAAAEWADAGAPTGALVTADHQSEGRGRLGRVWADEPGRDLALSLVLRPKLRPEHLGLVPLAAALAVCDAISGANARLASGVALKWPNDVLLEGQKVAGVLGETRWRTCGSGSQSPTVLLGIGVNVNRRTFPPELAARATSLALTSGADLDRSQILADLLLALERRFALSPEAIVHAAEAQIPALGNTLQVGFPGTDRAPLIGTALGLSPSGALRLEASGEIVDVHAGETTVLP
ncbi:biotin--[acetyl-CoA-carboxylase] ligase [Rubricoccus marinus]|uniref:Biotin--[acetyl-CoA-carboxylase] ligase n=1 Tax=Rubricoccus marinus TaxID=716817 RepID=A0A259TY67_9BACT|nr:biotin--[acetyl-CoA-carboxylase] ligase [Rubricoccus marinus]OZC02514.1 biotin--[acetyl-CoA-carboxylase] ligase [Rubricoccus marinus]